MTGLPPVEPCAAREGVGRTETADEARTALQPCSALLRRSFWGREVRCPNPGSWVDTVPLCGMHRYRYDSGESVQLLEGVMLHRVVGAGGGVRQP